MKIFNIIEVNNKERWVRGKPWAVRLYRNWKLELQQIRLKKGAVIYPPGGEGKTYKK
jgi:hypothetical protein